MTPYINKFKNGLTLVEVPDNDSESVMVNFMVKVGSRNERIKEHGISHFLEHFLFKGTKKYPSSRSITDLIEGIGGETNAATGKEFTHYYIKAHKDNTELLFEILTDMLQNPLFDKTELEKEKGVVVEEINMYKDIPKVEVSYNLETMLWPKNSLGRTIVGTPKSVTSFTTAMFQDYLDRYYISKNIFLGISGGYDRKLFKKLVNKYWYDHNRKTKVYREKAINRQHKPSVAIRYKETEQAHIAIGFEGLKNSHPREVLANVLVSILGGGMSSRLFYEIREVLGLAYYINCNSTNYQDTGVISINAGVKVDKIEEAILTIFSELKKITNELVFQSELERVKAYLKGRMTLSLEDHSSNLDWYLDQAAFSNKVRSPKVIFDMIDEVTPKELLNLAKKIFNPKKLNLAVVGPYKSSKNFEKLVKKYE